MTYSIQVDMFEVQLGAAMLVQLRISPKQAVNILADAGVHASGYPRGHVHLKLLELFAEQRQSNVRRLDLVIGTHYDADHLDGLVPIINDPTIEIGEAWLPPVANDHEAHAVEAVAEEHMMLAKQFEQENGQQYLVDYIKGKARTCERLKTLHSRGLDAQVRLREQGETQPFPPFLNEPPKPETIRRYFRAEYEDASRTIGGDSSHAAFVASPEGVSWSPPEQYFARYGRPADRVYMDLFDRWDDDRTTLAEDAGILAHIRRAAAADAINATSLYEVVQALRARGITIRCRTIDDGCGCRFVWDGNQNEFVLGKGQSATDITLTLLGPSQGLVKRHWKRLPLGDYMYMTVFDRVPVKSITPSNQLSYVVKVGFKGQSVLISGDAGFVDFMKPGSRTYFPDLLRELLPLHVVQVAHHGGNNAHFYNVLGEAKYLEQKATSFLLFSHATHDRFRPSDVFARFIAQAPQKAPITLLFTAEPAAGRISAFRGLIGGPQPPSQTAAQIGDVRLAFQRNRWKVLKHAIGVGAPSVKSGARARPRRRSGRPSPKSPRR